MRALVWIAEDTWEGCVDRARGLVPDDAEITLLHVAPTDVERMASGGAFRARAIRVTSWPMATSDRSRQVVPPASSRPPALIVVGVVIC